MEGLSRFSPGFANGAGQKRHGSRFFERALLPHPPGGAHKAE
jgi:hypothetical protein